jgi:RNase P/RNase MRP subunit p30
MLSKKTYCFSSYFVSFAQARKVAYSSGIRHMYEYKKKKDVLLVLGLQPTSSRETWNPTASLSHEVATEWTTPQVKKQ